MAKRRQNLPTDDDLEPSAIGLNPYYRLATAMIIQAFSDLRDVVHPERAVEAFCWLQNDGLYILTLLGFEYDDCDLFRAIGGTHAKKVFRASEFANDDQSGNTRNEQ